MKIIFTFLLVLISSTSNILADDWVITYTGLRSRFERLHVIGSQNVYAIEIGGPTLLRSTNQGISWDTVNKGLGLFKQSVWSISDYSAPSDKFHYIGFYERQAFLKSNDSGYTFEKVFLDTNASNEPFLINMYNENIGFMQSRDYFFVTNDGWNTKQQRIKKYLFDDPYFVDSTNLRFIFLSNKSIKYMNYDLISDSYTELYEFVKDTTAAYPETPLKFEQVNDSLIFAAGYQAKGSGFHPKDVIFRSKDGGHNWETILNHEYPPAFGLNNISFYDSRNGIAVGNYGTIYFTKDGGETWVPSKLLDSQESIDSLGIDGFSLVWSGRTPILGSFSYCWRTGYLFRYEGDFFDFSLDSPQLYFPTEKSVRHDTAMTFVWSESAEAESYQFRLSQDSLFTQVIENKTSTSLKTTVSGLSPGTRYYWSVTAKRGAETKESEIHSFTTKLGNVNLFSPQCDTTLDSIHVKFTWEPIPAAEYYTVSVFDSTGNFLFFNNTDQNEYETDLAFNLKKYCWHVTALADRDSAFSDLCCFRISDNVSVGEFDKNFKGIAIQNIYPNPGKKIVYINFDNGTNEPTMQLSVHNELGEYIIKDRIINTDYGRNRYELNLDGIASGRYYVVLSNGTLRASYAIAVEK